MGKKPTDYIQVKIRMRESLKRKLERAAEKKAISANAEAIERIERTFNEEATAKLETLLERVLWRLDRLETHIIPPQALRCREIEKTLASKAAE